MVCGGWCRAIISLFVEILRSGPDSEVGGEDFGVWREGRRVNQREISRIIRG